jgi:hypothetical protein
MLAVGKKEWILLSHYKYSTGTHCRPSHCYSYQSGIVGFKKIFFLFKNVLKYFIFLFLILVYKDYKKINFKKKKKFLYTIFLQ